MKKRFSEYLIPAVSLSLGMLLVGISRPANLAALRDCCEVTSLQGLQRVDILRGVPLCPSFPPRGGTLLRVIGPDDCGTVIQIWCAKGTLDIFGKAVEGTQYQAIVKKSDPPGFSRIVAKCSYEAGANAATLFQVPDTNGNGKPDCFVFLRWWNDDDGADDDGDGKIDGDAYDYDFRKNSLTQTHLDRSSPWQVESSQTTIVDYTGTEIDDIIERRVAPLCQMFTTSFNVADIEYDRDVDNDDVSAFYAAFGSSLGDANYLPMADINVDGKVDGSDELLLNEALAGDIDPPVIQSFTVSPTSIWPPSNKLVPLTVNVVVSDTSDPVPTWNLIFIENNEDPECDPDHPNELVHEDHAMVRATRFGNGNGRVYTVTVQAVDASGNAARAQATVTVPHTK